MINHEQLLGKYIYHTFNFDSFKYGRNFLDDSFQTSSFSNEEWDELKRLSGIGE